MENTKEVKAILKEIDKRINFQDNCRAEYRRLPNTYRARLCTKQIETLSALRQWIANRLPS